MTYVLGTATSANTPARLQNTCQGDDFFSLGKAYGVDPSVIIQLQPELRGKVINNKTVQAFVKSRPGWSKEGGGMRPFKPGTKSTDNPGTIGPDGKPEGFAIFTDATQLMLPDMPRLDGKVPRGPAAAPPVVEAPPVLKVVEAGINPVLVIGGIGLLAFALFGGKKKDAKKDVKKLAPAKVAM